MHYEMTIATKTKDVAIEQVESLKSNIYSGAIDGKKSRIEILFQNENRIIVSIDKRVYSITILKRTPSQVILFANGKIIEAQIRSSAIATQVYSTAASIGGLVKSNFPAKIIKINVRVGDSLKQGDTIIVLEAMKMEAQIRVPQDCLVKEILVKEGEMVERGKALARLESR